jgi:hypothetical protein
VSDLRDRITLLASRGTPRGFDAVFDAAARVAMLEVVDAASVGAADEVPFVSDEPLRPLRPRRLTSLVAAAGLSALLMVGMLAVSALVGGGGANTPEGAVRRLADAIAHEDPLAAADVLAPSELKRLHDTVGAAAEKAAELALVERASAPLAGLDLSVDDLELQVEQLGEDHAKVGVRGVLRARTEEGDLSPLMQKVLDETGSTSGEKPLDDLAPVPGVPAFLMVVREHGHWYVSVAYTTLEYLRVSEGLAPAELGAGRRETARLGAESPDAAVQGALRAFAANDWARLIELAPPDELPLYDYRAALLELAARQELDAPLRVTSVSTTARVDGDTAKVRLRFEAIDEDGQPLSWDGGCWTAEVDSDRQSFCIDKRWSVSRYSYFVTGERITDGPSEVTVVRRGGRWFVSPVGTVLDVADMWIANMDRRGLYDILDIAYALDPDGVLTLGEPVHVGDGTPNPLVLSFTGRRGQRLLGTSVGPGDGSPSVRFHDADGTVVGNPLYGDEITLPADGEYRVVIRQYANAPWTVTVWNASDVPAEVRENPYYREGTAGTVPAEPGG